MLAVVINSELWIFSSLIPAGVKNRLRRLVSLRLPLLCHEMEFHRNCRNRVIVPGLTFNQSDEIFVHAFGVLPAVIARLTRRIFDI